MKRALFCTVLFWLIAANIAFTHISHGKPCPAFTTVSKANQLLPFGQELEYNENSTEPTYTLNFTNKELDRELGLNYFGARYYYPHLARFISPDPVGGMPENPMSWNRYLYCRNDPDGEDAQAYAETLRNIAALDLMIPDPGDLSIVKPVVELILVGATTAFLMITADDVIDNILTQNSNNSNDSKSNAKAGQKVGGSGKPISPTVKHPTEKKAKDAAQAETAKGKAPVKHKANPEKDVPKHYHPVDSKGNLKPKHHDVGRGGGLAPKIQPIPDDKSK